MRDLESRYCAGSPGRALDYFGESDKGTRSTAVCFVRWVFPGEAHTRGVGRSGRRNVARRRRRGGQATRPDRFQFFSFPADTGQRPRLCGNAAVVLPTLSELVIPQVRHFEGGGVAWFVVQNIISSLSWLPDRQFCSQRSEHLSPGMVREEESECWRAPWCASVFAHDAAERILS